MVSTKENPGTTCKHTKSTCKPKPTCTQAIVLRSDHLKGFLGENPADMWGFKK